LAWLGVEPDELVTTKGPTAASELVDNLVQENMAYACYCTPAELREMPTAPRDHKESTLYDGRCRSLSADDQKALGKAGRKPSVRLRTTENPGEGLSKRLSAHLPKRFYDFVIRKPDGNVTAEFLAALHDDECQASHILLHQTDIHHLHQRILVASALGLKPPQFTIIFGVTQTGGEGKRWQTIGQLRDAGFHPVAVCSALLSAGFADAKDTPLRSQAPSFKTAKLAKTDSVIDLNALELANSDVLQDMDNNEQVSAVFAHLARKGFAFEGRDRRWQKKFVDLVLDDLQTLADAEAMACFVLTPGVSYERKAAELLRQSQTQALMDDFEKCIKKGKSNSLKDWKGVFGKFRGQVDVPGRALATLRVVLTGERAGPNLAILATLLGEDGTRLRLEKARKYRN
jgi:nondiscriminating glutamyl-tRNA synthetase